MQAGVAGLGMLMGTGLSCIRPEVLGPAEPIQLNPLSNDLACNLLAACLEGQHAVHVDSDSVCISKARADHVLGCPLVAAHVHLAMGLPGL